MLLKMDVDTCTNMMGGGREGEGGREGGRERCTCTLHVLLMFLIIVPTFIHSVTDNNDKILHIILIHVHVDVLLQNVMYMGYTFW